MNKQLTKALSSFGGVRPLEPSMAEALENLLEKAIADPTNGGTLVPVHIVDKNGHHTVRYHSREEVHALRAHKDNHHVSELQAGNRFSHEKNGDGVITKVKGHDGKGYELATQYDSGKKGTAYVHNVKLLKPEHEALPADAKADLKRRVMGGDDDNKGDSVYAKIQANKKPAADKPVVKKKPMPTEDTMKNIILPVRPRGGQDVLTRRQLDDMEIAIKQGRDGQINVTDVIRRVQQIGALGAAATYQKEVLRLLNTVKKPAGDDPLTRSGKSIMNGQFPHKQEGWSSADHEDAVDYHKSQRGSLTINGVTNTHADFARSHVTAADSRKAQDYKDNGENEFLNSTLPIGDDRYNEQRLKRTLRDNGDTYKAMKQYLQGEHALLSEDLSDDDNDTLANLLSRSKRDKITPDQLKFQLDTMAIEAQKRNARKSAPKLNPIVVKGSSDFIEHVEELPAKRGSKAALDNFLYENNVSYDDLSSTAQESYLNVYNKHRSGKMKSAEMLERMTTIVKEYKKANNIPRSKRVMEGKYYVGTRSRSPQSNGEILLNHNGDTLDHFDTMGEATNYVNKQEAEANKRMEGNRSTSYAMDATEAKKYGSRLDD